MAQGLAVRGDWFGLRRARDPRKPGGAHALFLALTIWAFCRAYYFAFYVIEHYVDPGFKYAGLWDFVLRRFRS